MSEQEISRIAVKAPPFWRANPALWFAQIESQFITSKITADATKFHCVVAAIESDVLAQASDIVLNPPEANMYGTLKDRLIEQFSESQNRKLNRVIQELELGDRKPSQLLREMKNLAEGKLSEEVLKSLWLQRLPTNVQTVLAISNESIDKLAAIADKILEMTASRSSMLAVESKAEALPSESNRDDDRLQRLEKQILALGNKIERLGRARSRSPSPYARSRSQSGARYGRTICWYHSRFGTRANRCVQPCNFKGKEN